VDFDFNKLLDCLIPWDATITIGGTAYRLRPLSLGDVARLESIGNAGPGRTADEDRAFLLSLFVGGSSPPVNEMGGSERTFLAVGALALFREHTRKNPGSIVSATAAAMGSNA
jgi:hypothetical protein